MEETVNQRVIVLKEHFNLGRNEFAVKANISPSTYDNIVNGGNMYPKTIKTICIALNVNENWLTKGEGPIFNPDPKTPAANTFTNEPLTWQDATYKSMQEQIEMLKALVKHLSKGELNFHEPLDKQGALVVAINNEAYLKASAA